VIIYLSNKIIYTAINPADHLLHEITDDNYNNNCISKHSS